MFIFVEYKILNKNKELYINLKAITKLHFKIEIIA